MKKISGLVGILLLSVVMLVLAVGLGSVQIHPANTLNVILDHLFSWRPFGAVDSVTASILIKIRIPRAFLAYVCGAGLAVSGVMMQSVLRNPLASSFTLGVSSGAALGASIAILLGTSVFGFLTLPVFGLGAGLLTVFAALGVTVRIDRSLQNNSIILTGMAFSLFANAMITIVMALSGEQLQRLVYWQMGSFAMKAPEHLFILTPVVALSLLLTMRAARPMDIMTLGEEQAETTGVGAKGMKWALLSLSAVITGAVVSVVGIIGFVDLFTPHVARKLFGASHRYVLPASAILGGTFMLLCDLIARTLVPPLELPVGAITSAVGAPFFIYLYFSKRRRTA